MSASFTSRCRGCDNSAQRMNYLTTNTYQISSCSNVVFQWRKDKAGKDTSLNPQTGGPESERITFFRSSAATAQLSLIVSPTVSWPVELLRGQETEDCGCTGKLHYTEEQRNTQTDLLRYAYKYEWLCSAVPRCECVWRSMNMKYIYKKKKTVCAQQNKAEKHVMRFSQLPDQAMVTLQRHTRPGMLKGTSPASLMDSDFIKTLNSLLMHPEGEPYYFTDNANAAPFLSLTERDSMIQ